MDRVIQRRKFIRMGVLWLLSTPAILRAQMFTPGMLVTTTKPAAAGGGTPAGNAFTLVQQVAWTETNSINITPAAGNLVVAFCKTEGSAAFTSAALSAQSATLGNVSTHGNGDLRCAFAWILSNNSASAQNFAFTLSGSPTFSRCLAAEFSATGTHALDAQGSGNSGTSGSIASGSFSSSVSNGLALGGYGEYSGNALLNLKVGTTAATGLPATQPANATWAWYRLFTAQLSGVTSNATMTSAEWVCAGLCFKSE